MQPSQLEQVLRRTGMERGQITLLKELYEREGKSVSSAELGERIRGYDAIEESPEDSIPGVLGAFGRRINESDTVVEEDGIEVFIDREKRDNLTYYKLKPEAREAVERYDELMEQIQRPMEDLVNESPTLEGSWPI
jgi:hypothetical protein